MRAKFAFGIFALSASIAFAQTSSQQDKATQEALGQTQQLLRDKQQREKALQQNPQAMEQHKRVQQLTGSEKNTDAVYDISADIMDNLVKDANGDPQKMQELMQQAQKDPAAFYNKLTPEQKARIKALSEQISPQPQANSAPARK